LLTVELETYGPVVDR